MRTIVASLAGAALAVGILAGAARAEFIVFLHSFGEWTVICGRDEPTRQERCRMSAPPPTMPGPEGGPQLRLDVFEGVGEAPRIALHIYHAVDTQQPVTLLVDRQAPHQTLPPRTGDVIWTGADAQAILAEMIRGKVLTISFFTPGAGTLLTRDFQLDTFGTAFDVYRQVVAEHRATGG